MPRRTIWARLCGLASTIATWVRHDAARQSGQADAARQIAYLFQGRNLLLIEKKIVVAMRAKAKRQHKRLSHFDARLKQINAELLRIGGQR